MGRWYGLCPTQLSGKTAEGRPFYFRSRHGQWTLRIGDLGWGVDYVSWSDDGYLVAAGDTDVNDPDHVDALVTEHLGEGWTV